MTSSTTDDLVVDLLRAGWIIEASRAAVYRDWMASEARFGNSLERALLRTEEVEKELTERGGLTAPSYVAGHAAWMREMAGERPGEVPLGDLLLVRLADWVEAHAGHFMNSGGSTLTRLGEAEKDDIAWPDDLPTPPPYEPLEPIEPEPPGEVRFRFALLGDLHFGSEFAEEMVAAAIADINAAGVDLVIQLGDATDRGNPGDFEAAVAGLDDLEAPLHVIIGNHDVFSYEKEQLMGRELFERYFGRAPDGALFEHKGVKFALLDSAEHALSPFSPYNLVTGSFLEGRGGAVVRGALSEAQHDILAEIAAPTGGPAFVFLHHPPQPFTSFPPLLFGLREVDSGRLHAMCDSGNVWGIFAGHTHRNRRTTEYSGVPVQEVAIPRDYPFGYALVDVTDRGYAYSFRQISDRDLLVDAYRRAGLMHRRYAAGSGVDRGFVYETPGATPTAD